MKEILNRIRFEQLMIFMIMMVLTIALFVYGDTPETLNLILGALIGAFTNNMVNKEKDGLK